jgi:hypothetical protein
VGAKQSQDCGKATVVEVRVMGGRRRANGVNPNPGRSIYRGPLDLPVVVPSAVQHASTALFREIREKIAPNSRDSEFRSSTDNNISSGHPDNKQVQQAPHITLI